MNVIFNSKCRLCGLSNDNMINLFEDDPVTVRLHVKVSMISYVKIEVDDGLPSVICSSCHSQVENWYKFKNNCQKVDSLLRKELSLLQHDEQEHTVNTHTSNSNDNTEHSLDGKYNTVSTEETVMIKTEENDSSPSFAVETVGNLSHESDFPDMKKEYNVDALDFHNSAVVIDSDSSNSFMQIDIAENKVEVSPSLSFHHWTELLPKESVSSVAMEYKCENCDTVYKTKRSLKKHVSNNPTTMCRGSRYVTHKLSGKISKSRRAEWTEEQLQAAINAVKKGASLRVASKSYSIPRTTLRNHLVRGSCHKKLGRDPHLTKEMENELCAHIFQLCETGMPITPKVLRQSVFNFCLLKDLNHPFNNKKRMAGTKWLQLFLMRHPDVMKLKAQKINMDCAMKLNRFVISNHFQKLRALMIEKDFINSPDRIYNINEKRICITMHEHESAPQSGAEQICPAVPEHVENVTLVACANAVGNIVPPMIIFKGEKLNPEWNRNVPTGTRVVVNGKGSMTTLVFINWLRHFSKYKAPGDALLIFDGASSLLDANIIPEADKLGIILYCIPRNMTHILQPMAKGVFKPFKSYWGGVLSLSGGKKTTNVNRSNCDQVFSKVWEYTVTPSNVINGFRDTGVYPFDPCAIPEEVYAPSIQTEVVQNKDPEATNVIYSDTREDYSDNSSDDNFID